MCNKILPPFHSSYCGLTSNLNQNHDKNLLLYYNIGVRTFQTMVCHRYLARSADRSHGPSPNKSSRTIYFATLHASVCISPPSKAQQNFPNLATAMGSSASHAAPPPPPSPAYAQPPPSHSAPRTSCLGRGGTVASAAMSRAAAKEVGHPLPVPSHYCGGGGGVRRSRARQL